METAANFDRDQRLARISGFMQTGAWEKAVAALEELQAEYNGDPKVASLLDEATKKAQFDEPWIGKTNQRRIVIDKYRVLPILFVVIFVFLVAFIRMTLNRNYIYPSIEANTQEQDYLAVLNSAESALQSGDYSTAATDFSEAMKYAPVQEQAKLGLAQAQQMVEVSRLYDEAVAAVAQHDVEAARRLFLQVDAMAPGYRDVEIQLQGMTEQQEIGQLLDEAETAYNQGDWEQAIPAYEQLRRLDASYLTTQVSSHLYDAYMKSSDALLKNPDVLVLKSDLANERIRRAMLLRPDDPESARQARIMRTYISGMQALSSGDLISALKSFLSIYDVLPSFLGGLIADQLYKVYLMLGDQQLASSERLAAIDYYARAANLPVSNTTDARTRLEAISAGSPPTPSPTPTPTPIPNPTSQPLTGAALAQAAPPLKSFKGWIAFISDRDGDTGLYVMRPDGSRQQRVRDEDMALYDQMREKEQRSPDGTTRVYAEGVKGQANDVNIIIFREDLPAGWDRRFQYTDWAGLEYDPAWSPDNKWIAFVATATGNDEIWNMTSNGTDSRQLTFNTWEWDKHPTWSPDSTKIAFWSNRSTGHGQIWVMDVDGKNQFNLSNNDYEDREPVWIK